MNKGRKWSFLHPSHSAERYLLSFSALQLGFEGFLWQIEGENIIALFCVKAWTVNTCHGVHVCGKRRKPAHSRKADKKENNFLWSETLVLLLLQLQGATSTLMELHGN